MDEMIDKAYEAIEVAKATGKIKKGVNEVTKAIERGTAKFVAVAKDVNPPEITMHIPILAKEKNVPVVIVTTRDELGAAAGIDVPTVCVAIVQEGDAKKLLKVFASEEKEEVVEAKEESKPEAKEEVKPEVKEEVKPEAKEEVEKAKEDSKPEVKEEVKPEEKSE